MYRRDDLKGVCRAGLLILFVLCNKTASLTTYSMAEMEVYFPRCASSLPSCSDRKVIDGMLTELGLSDNRLEIPVLIEGFISSREWPCILLYIAVSSVASILTVFNIKETGA